jgi:sporulation protein YlmC with PRC-barrel domain
MLAPADERDETMDGNDTRFDLKRISNAAVLDGSGQRLGEISELVFNTEYGCVEYVRLQLESDPDVPLEVVIPWSQFRLAPDRNHLRLDISPMVLRIVAHRLGRS